MRRDSAGRRRRAEHPLLGATAGAPIPTGIRSIGRVSRCTGDRERGRGGTTRPVSRRRDGRCSRRRSRRSPGAGRRRSSAELRPRQPLGPERPARAGSRCRRAGPSRGGSGGIRACRRCRARSSTSWASTNSRVSTVPEGWGRHTSPFSRRSTPATPAPGGSMRRTAPEPVVGDRERVEVERREVRGVGRAGRDEQRVEVRARARDCPMSGARPAGPTSGCRAGRSSQARTSGGTRRATMWIVERSGGVAAEPLELAARAARARRRRARPRRSAPRRVGLADGTAHGLGAGRPRHSVGSGSSARRPVRDEAGGPPRRRRRPHDRHDAIRGDPWARSAPRRSRAVAARSAGSGRRGGTPATRSRRRLELTGHPRSTAASAARHRAPSNDAESVAKAKPSTASATSATPVATSPMRPDGADRVPAPAGRRAATGARSSSMPAAGSTGST